MYRPTVRYSDTYRKYINDLFRVTTLDRNQILRLALHVAAHSNQFKQILDKYKSGDVPLPHPDWLLYSHGLWMDNSHKTIEGGKDVNVIDTRTRSSEGTSEASSRDQEQRDRCEQPIERRDGEIPSRRIEVRNQGEIKLVF